MRFYLTPVRMAIIKKSPNNKSYRGCREKGTLLVLLVRMQVGAVRRFLRKLKIELPYDPTVTLLGIYSDKTVIQKRYMHF